MLTSNPRCRVRNWALKFGVDLWEFSRQFTKANDIKNVSFTKIRQANEVAVNVNWVMYLQKYTDMDGDVNRKDGILLLREFAQEVKNFMDFKMNSVLVSIGSVVADLISILIGIKRIALPTAGYGLGRAGCSFGIRPGPSPNATFNVSIS